MLLHLFQSGARDFNLLINLLAESQGLPESMRILSLFEHQFRALWQPKNIRIIQRDTDLATLNVAKPETETETKEKSDEEKPEKEEKKLKSIMTSWDDAEIADYFHG